jgi:hypothetical protein
MLLVTALFNAFIDTLCTEYIAVLFHDAVNIADCIGSPVKWWVNDELERTKKEAFIVQLVTLSELACSDKSQYGERQARWPMFQPRFEQARTYRIQTWSVATTPACSIIHGALLIFFGGEGEVDLLFRTLKVFKKYGCRRVCFAWRGYMTRLLLSVQKHFSLTVTVPAANVLTANVLGTGIFHWHLVP